MGGKAGGGPRYTPDAAVECIEAMEAVAANYEDGAAGLLAAQVIRYVWRADHGEDPIEELDKAIDYCRRLRARLDGRPGEWDRPKAVTPLARAELSDEHRLAWQRFRATGLLWWTNRLLHAFGWAITYWQDDAMPPDHPPIAVSARRVLCREFGRRDEEDGFQRLARYLQDNAALLAEGAEGDDGPAIVERNEAEIRRRSRMETEHRVVVDGPDAYGVDRVHERVIPPDDEWPPAGAK